MYVIIFIVILALLVFVHELGHFLVAKAFGIRVDEFAIGFPPRLFSFKKGETRYAINLIPFGGYVKIFGEDNDDASASDPSLTPADKSRSFANKPKTIQALVLLAGISFNILFAWMLVCLGFMVGMPVPDGYAGKSVPNAALTVTAVEKNSPADFAGLKLGDHITALKYEDDIVNHPNGDQIQNFTAYHKNKEIEIDIQNDAGSKRLMVTPLMRPGNSKATIGISMEVLGTLKLNFFESVVEGTKLTYYLVTSTAVGIVTFIGTAFRGQAHISDVTGPVGIAGIVGDATKLGFIYLLSFTAFISINLAIINLIPFPALDGGRVLFVIIEKIRGKAIQQKVVQVINTTGLALLLLLMVIVTFHDILKLFGK